MKRHIDFVKTGAILYLIASIITGTIFNAKTHLNGTPADWKYYFSLTGFIIFLSMLILSIIANIFFESCIKNKLPE
ncbi:MAG: hypothetical protein ACSHWW_02845 [Nonlabens sp.]|uniref:hypothetical protein n=1 Tax=Nonlabens sp. TaxID=1888209 RepID=UPI003EF8F53A